MQFIIPTSGNSVAGKDLAAEADKQFAAGCFAALGFVDI